MGSRSPENEFTIYTAVSGERAFLRGRNRVSGHPLSQVDNVYSVLNGMATPTRAAWQFDFQFSPLAGSNPTDYTYEIQADMNPAFGVATFTTISVPDSVILAAPIGDSYYPNGNGGSISGTDASPTYSYTAGWTDATIPFVIANSQNYNFPHLAGSGFTNNGYAQYEIRATMYTTGGAPVASSTIFVEVIPEPATASLLAIGAIGMLAQRRRA